MSQEKQNPATETRKNKALEEGNVAVSRKLFHAVAAFFLVVLFLLRHVFAQHFLHRFPQTLSEAQTFFGRSGALLGAFFLLLWATVAAVGGLQTGFRTFPKRKKPSFGEGLKNMLSKQKIVKLAKDVAVSALFLGVFYRTAGQMARREWPFGNGVIFMHEFGRFLGTLCAVATLLGLTHYAWTLFQWFKKLAMSREDLQSEQKEQEGDPKMRQRRFQKQKEILGSVRSTRQISQATLVLTNPTHYTVGIQWTKNMPTPIVVAKGKGGLAKTLRGMARQKGIPVIAQPSLARRLFQDVPLNKAIPSGHYRAVAEVIRAVLAQNPHAFD